MKPKTMMFMGGAVVCGLVAAVMTNRLLAERQEMVEVLVARQTLNEFQPIRDPEKLFERQQQPKTQVPKDYVVGMDNLQGRSMRKKINQGAILTHSDLTEVNRSSLDTQITPGKVAYALATNVGNAGGGFILPGSRVNVIHVGGGQSAEAKLVLQNILVRAVDTTNVRPEDRHAIPPNTVTLEVTNEEALELAKRSATGQMKLVLRAADDQSRVEVAEEKKELPELPLPALPAEIKESPSVEPKDPIPSTTESPTIKPKAREWVQTLRNGNKVTKVVYRVQDDGKYKFHKIIRDGNDDEGGESASTPQPVVPETPGEGN
jgi:pilus assembly protein CpaB